MAKERVPKCVICDIRPRMAGNIYCHHCNNEIRKLKAQSAYPEPVHFYTWKDMVWGLYPTYDGKGHYLEFMKREPEGLPPSKTTNLNEWLPDKTREEVKCLKASLLQAAKLY